MAHRITRDNLYGRLIFDIHHHTKNSKAFYSAHAKLVASEWSRPPGRRPFNQVVWGIFTGSDPYRRILDITLLNPMSVVRFGWAMFAQTIRLLCRMDDENFLCGEPEQKKNILILGCGFGGLYTALNLQKVLRRDKSYAIVMVGNENFFLFTPFLDKVACGAIEAQHIAYPIRRLRRHPRFYFHKDDVRSIDLEGKKVVTGRGVLNYDFLVLALGSTTDTRQLPSFENNVFFLKTLFDGLIIRNHMISIFEQADVTPQADKQSHLLTFVVVGGGYTGVQLITEINDFIRGSLVKGYRRIYPALIKIILVEGGPRIMGEMDEQLADDALAYLKSQGIEVLLNSCVTGMSEKTIEINDKRTIFTHTIVWATGVVANPIVAQLPVDKDDSGRIKVNECLQVRGYPKVYGVGDNACFIDRRTGEALPPRAHFAIREAKVAARNIWADIRGKRTKAYNNGSNPAIVSLGSRAAVADIYGFHLHGMGARFLWLVSYLMLMKGILNRVRVATDWLLNRIFGRDTTLLRVEKSRSRGSMDDKE